MRKMLITQRVEHGLDIIRVENDHLRVDVIPALGGKISSVFNKEYGREFLWNNTALDLQENQPGDDYDSSFWGGIDELLPNDLPEDIDGNTYPDHGELWTSRLGYTVSEDVISVHGMLPLSGLYYQKAIYLQADAPKINLAYNIINRAGETRRFLWKLHAAVRIAAGDWLVSPARKAKIVNLEASRFNSPDEFGWPVLEGVDASVIPTENGTMDFFYLYDSPDGEMSLITENNKFRFSYHYDQRIFPYQWYFASYGRFRGHYTAILEPASAMPANVSEAAALKQCSSLEAGEAINTQVVIYAGPHR